jgi:hypothetical protein
VNDIQVLPREHLANIAIPGRYAIANSKLLGQQRLTVAYCRELCPCKMFHYFGMPVGNLSAADDPNPQLPQIRHPQ